MTRSFIPAERAGEAHLIESHLAGGCWWPGGLTRGTADLVWARGLSRTLLTLDEAG